MRISASTPVLPRFSTRFSLAKLTLSIAAATVVLAIGAGCDDSHSADKRVLQTIEQARLERIKPEGGQQKADELLTKAAAEANAAAATKAYAKAMLAQAQLDDAVARLSDPEKGIDAQHREISRLLWEIGQLGQQISNTNTLAKAYAQFEPKEARSAIQARLAEVNGAAGKPNWVGEGANAIPTLATAQQQVQQLQAQVTQQQEQIKQMDAKRQQLMGEAQKASRVADTAPGQQGLEAFKAASALRKSVADTSNQIEVAQAKLAPMQQDLSLAQARQNAAAAAVEQFQRQAQELEKGWTDVQKQLGGQAELAKAILQGGGSTKTLESIADKVTKLKKVEADAKTLEEDVGKELEDAINNFDQAAAAAQQLSADVRSKVAQLPKDNPMRKSLDTLVSVYDPNVFRLGQANARLTLANLQASKAQLQAERAAVAKDLATALADAKLSPPAGLDSAAAANEAKTTAATADTAYDDAMKQFLEVAEAPSLSEAEKSGGRAGHVYALYGRSLLGRATNDPKGAQYLNDAKSARDQILQENRGALPALPAELVVIAAPTTAPAAPASAPSETPASAPASAPAPAEGIAPAPAPAAPATQPAP